MKKSTPLWCEDCRLVCFQTGLGKPILTLNDPNGLKNTTNVYSIHLELQMALSCQISAGKWKYVNPCLDFLGIPDQRTAYVKRQVRPGWTCVRRSSVTPDLFNRSRPKLNCGAGRDFWVGPKFGARRKQPIIPGNSRARSCAGEEDRVTWLDLRPG